MISRLSQADLGSYYGDQMYSYNPQNISSILFMWATSFRMYQNNVSHQAYIVTVEFFIFRY